MVYGFGILQFFIVGMMGVVKAMRSEHFLATNEDQLFVWWDPEDLVWRHELTSAKRVCLTVAGCVIGDTHGVEFSHGSFHFHTGDSNTIAEVFCSKHVSTAEEHGRVTSAEDLLPLVIRIAVLHLTDILKEDCNGYATATDGTALLLEVRDTTRTVWKLIQDESHFRWESIPFTSTVCIADESNE